MSYENMVIDRTEIELPGKIFGSEGRLIARTAIAMGLHVEVITPKIFVVSSESKEEIFHLNMAGSISHTVKLISWDKQLTKTFLDRSGVKSPSGITFDVSKERDKAINYFKESGHKTHVLKPLNGILGASVFLDVTEVEDMLKKCDVIGKRYKNAMLEEQVYGTECRYFVVGDQVRAVMERIPGNVVGDGIKTTKELIVEKNKARDKHFALKKIKIDDETKDLLDSQGLSLNDVPEVGRAVRLKRVSNLSQGGDSVDVTDTVHDDLKEIAVKAVQSIPTLSYAGLDIIAEDHSAPAAGQQVNVLEINWNPMVTMHHAPAVGKPRDIAGDIIDHLFFK